MKIGFVSLGCPKNLVDGEVMLGYAQKAGHEITASSADADVIVVNTCAFIDNAKQESIDAILEMAQHKRDGKASRLVVTGCLAERYREELKKEIPEIDALLGTGEVPGIVDAIEARGTSRGAQTSPLKFHRPSKLRGPGPEPQAPNPVLPTYIYDADSPRVITTPKHFAYMKIAEGCDYTCA
ncbi:MAG TPA: 30S ribosomal protein S12 methylthiotransferase RimO, partial [Thermoanaerobaculia bacterium]